MRGDPARTLSSRAVVIPELAQSAVGVPPVGLHERAGFDDLADEPGQGRRGSVLDDLHTDSAGAGCTDLHCHHDKGFGAVLPAAAQFPVKAADEALVHLDRAGQRCALRVDHRPTQLVQDHPGGLLPADRELARQLCRWSPRRAGFIRHAAQNHRCSGLRVPCSAVPAVSDT